MIFKMHEISEQEKSSTQKEPMITVTQETLLGRYSGAVPSLGSLGCGKENVLLGGQGTSYLLSNCIYQPHIDS